MTDSPFTLLAGNTSDVVTLHDGNGALLEASHGAVRFFGEAAAFPGSTPFWELLSTEDAPYLAEEFAGVLRDGETRYVEWRSPVDAESGTPVVLETRISLATTQGKSAPLVLCLTRSVESRHRREAELRRRYDEGRALLERAVYGIYRSTEDGRLLYVNGSMARMLGYDTAEQLQQVDARHLYADPGDRELLLRRMREGRLGGWTHVRWRTREGSVILVRLVVNTVYNDNGDLLFFEGIAEDVTESQRREEIVRRNERMASMGTMLAGVAHELNNPLAAISGFAQILLRGDALSEEDRGAVETINHEANRAARIVRDLQTFARERTFAEREEVNLNDVVSYVLASQRYKMDTHGIVRDVRLASSLPVIHAERAHIEQILINLIANATAALESITDAPPVDDSSVERIAPTITIVTGVRDADVVLEVIDNGPGISEEHLSRIFDPFFTTRPEGQGTGLGLAVVHGIVSSYGGTLDVESKVGRGSHFRVTLPIAVDDPATLEGFAPATDEGDEIPEASGAEDVAPERPRAESTVAAKVATAPSPAPAVQRPTTPARKRTRRVASKIPPPARSLDILIVEDEGAIRRLLERYLEARGHAVVSADNGIEALRVAEQAAFDVVLCDLRLPGIDGVEVLLRLRRLPTGARARCILMSGANARTPAGAVQEQLRLAAVVDKPFEIEELCKLIEG